MITYILLFILSTKPLYSYGRQSYVALVARDYSKLKANLLFLFITIAVLVGVIIAIKAT